MKFPRNFTSTFSRLLFFDNDVVAFIFEAWQHSTLFPSLQPKSFFGKSFIQFAEFIARVFWLRLLRVVVARRASEDEIDC